MPATRTTRTEQQAATRKRLLEGAAAVFERDGFHRARLEDVAAEAGVTTGAVYSNFAGKDELFLALAEHQISERLEQIRTVAAAGAGDPDRGIEAEVATQFRSFFEASQSFPLLFHEFWTYGARRPELRERFESHRARLRDALADALIAGAEARGLEFTVEPATVATVIRATLNGLAFEAALDEDGLPPEAMGWTIGSLVRAASRPRA